MADNSSQGSDTGSQSDEGMTDRDLGQAKIVYEDPEDGQMEKQVANDGIAYFQDHWIVRTGQTQRGHDTVRRIPAHRVYYVERDVEKFEEEVKSIRNQVQSLAQEVKSKLSSGESGGGSGGGSGSGSGGSHRSAGFDDRDAW